MNSRLKLLVFWTVLICTALMWTALHSHHRENPPGQAQQANVDGALRQRGVKELLLQTNGDTVLRFRLLAKTQFRGPQGAPIRDSLLNPGDRLSVMVNRDDPETAVRVVGARWLGC